MAINCFAAQSLRLDLRFSSSKTFADVGIEDVFRTAVVTHLEIIPECEQDHNLMVATQPAEDWAVVLRAFPHLTHLAVSGPDGVGHVVNALGAVEGHGAPAYANSDVLTSGSSSPVCPVLRSVTLVWEVPRKITPNKRVFACDAAAYRQHRDVAPRVEQRFSAIESAMQLTFKRRASMGAQELDAFEFYEYERHCGPEGQTFDGAVVLGKLIVSSRRDDSDLPCLARLRTVVGGPVASTGVTC